MFRKQEGVKRPKARASRALAAALGMAVVGCADSGGLRSVWPDRLSLLGWRDRQQPSPDPANDYYAQYMHAARQRADSLARRTDDDGAGPSRGREESEPPGPDDPLVAQEAQASPASRPARRAPDSADGPGRDETIRVTLGTPEPLPTRSRPADPSLAMAAAASPPEAGRAKRRTVDEPGPAPRRPSSPTARPGPSPEEARAILARSEARLKSLGTYQVKMSRVERVDGRLQPEEEVILSVHRQPKEVRLQWASGPGQGREVIYSTRVDARSLFVHMPKTAIPLPTMKMPIDSPMVTRSSRHSITEAGFDTIIANLRKSVDQVDAASAAQGRAAYRGVEKPPGLDRPSHVFTRRSPSGETWTVFLDARTLLPSMVVAKDASGQLDEKYIYHEVTENPPELASADAFDPDRRWGEAKGLLSRFARGGAPTASPGTSQSAIR